MMLVVIVVVMSVSPCFVPAQWRPIFGVWQVQVPFAAERARVKTTVVRQTWKKL
jgi:hypothetical protein